MQNDTSIAGRLPRAEEEKEFLLTENERTSATPANGVKSESQNGPPLPSAQIPYVEVTDWTEFMTWDTDGLFFGDDVYSPVESFPVDTLQDRDVLLDNGYSLSGTPPSCTDSAYYSLLGDVSTPMTPSLISSQLATAFTASEGAKLKTATADTLDKQDEELHVKSSSFTTQGEETSGLTPVSRTQIPGSITCTTTESSPTTEQSVCSEGSSSSSEGGEAQDLESTRQQVLDRLMVQFYDIYAHHVQCTHRGTTGEGLSIIQSRTSARSECDRIDEKGKRTRKHDEDDGDGDGDDDVSKRRKLENQASQESQHTIKRLACPYHQHDPQKQQASRACSGPGWVTVHRIKEHLYRNHAMPLHCRRCYEIFDSETSLTEHSRNEVTCPVKQMIALEGFSKEQEKDLKGRRGMFRAGSEEHKWKIVYMILFPETPATEMPSPYYGDVRLNVVSADAPKSPDLQQFEAYMNRELPRKVRMALEAQMERLLGPIEETLKNELESIVQNCHKSLAETYLGTMQQNQLHPTNLSNTASSSSSRLFEITPPSDCPEADSSLNLYSQEISDFAQYSLPTPNSAEGSFEGPSNIATQQSWPPQLDASFSNTMGDDSWSSMWAQNFGHDFALDYAELGDIPVSFEGKGKGKAVVDEDFQVFHPSPSGED